MICERSCDTEQYFFRQLIDGTLSINLLYSDIHLFSLYGIYFFFLNSIDDVSAIIQFFSSSPLISFFSLANFADSIAEHIYQGTVVVDCQQLEAKVELLYSLW